MNQVKKAIEDYNNDSGCTKLILSNMDLIEIPEEVYTLTNLKYLDLSNNKIYEIPDKINKFLVAKIFR